MANATINKPEEVSFLDYELSDLINKLSPLAVSGCGFGEHKDEIAYRESIRTAIDVKVAQEQLKVTKRQSYISAGFGLLGVIIGAVLQVLLTYFLSTH